MKPEAYEFFRVEERDGYVVATLDRPEFDNTWTRAEDHELIQLTVDVAADPDVRVLVITGAGDSFSGGLRTGTNPFPDYDSLDRYDRCVKIFGAFTDLVEPIVVALNGPAAGTGLTLALYGDIVIAERQVRFADAHVLIDTVSATGAFLWPPSVGLLRSKRYLLTGDSFSAEEAERIGLVSEVVETGESLQRAEAFAARLASLPPNGLRGTKRALNRWLQSNFTSILEHGLGLEFMRFPQNAVLPDMEK
jgi:enoyl-CoA hydratase/carnithine racemase